MPQPATRSATPPAQAAPASGSTNRTFSARFLARGSRVVVVIVATAATMALIAALVLFHPSRLLLGAGIVFLYVLILGAPAWAAWMEREAERSGREERKAASAER